MVSRMTTMHWIFLFKKRVTLASLSKDFKLSPAMNYVICASLHHCNKIASHKQLKRGKHLFWLVVSEFPVCKLDPVFLGGHEAEHHGGQGKMEQSCLLHGSQELDRE